MTDNRQNRKPDWLKIKLNHTGEKYTFVSKIVKEHGLNTICGSGKCPNMSECWSRGTATFMILGNICTRACKFCATASGKPLAVDTQEHLKLARSIELMELKHCVITSVDRDDLEDGGAEVWKLCIEAIRASSPKTTIEVLIPDFDGKTELLDIILGAKPDIIGHNIETVRRLTPSIRSRAKYNTSLEVIKYLKSKGAVTKSGLMVGIGESDEEIIETINDLKEYGCQLLTIGQYLQPTTKHIAVDRYVHPSQFKAYKEHGLGIGFNYIESAPLVRSSYMADKAMQSTTQVTKQKVNLSDISSLDICTLNNSSCNK